MGSAPRPAAPAPAPLPPTILQTDQQEAVRGRDRARRRVAQAMHTRQTMISGDFGGGGSGGNTLLGQ